MSPTLFISQAAAERRVAAARLRQMFRWVTITYRAWKGPDRRLEYGWVVSCWHSLTDKEPALRL